MRGHASAVAIVCILWISAEVLGAVVTAPISFSGPGNATTAAGSLEGTIDVWGSGSLFTYDLTNRQWTSQGFTIAPQQLQLGLSPTTAAISATPTAAMTIEVENQALSSLTLASMSINLLGGALPEAALETMPVTIDLDAGGTTSIDLGGTTRFAPLTVVYGGNTPGAGGPTTWTLSPSAAVTAGAGVDVTASAGFLPLGYLFHAGDTQTSSKLVDMALTLSPSGGPWYVKDVDVAASIPQIVISGTAGGTFDVNSYSGSQSPYYAVSVHYNTSFDATLNDVEIGLHGTVTIPEPTSLALLALAPAAWCAIRRRR